MKIICYGDSNTYGYDGDSAFGGRFPETERWPELLETADTAAHMRTFITALTAAMPESAVLLCAPPAVEAEGGAFERACFELADAYAELSDELGLIYVNTLGWQIPTGGDGIHFSARGHRLFAMKLGQTLKEVLR